MTQRSIGTIGNHYGGLSVKEEDGKFYWSIDDYTGEGWEEISEPLYRALMAHEDANPQPLDEPIPQRPLDPVMLDIQRRMMQSWADQLARSPFAVLRDIPEPCDKGATITFRRPPKF